MKQVTMFWFCLCAAAMLSFNDASAQQENDCTNITIKFEYKISMMPAAIYCKEVIGTIASPSAPVNKIKDISVCIDGKAARSIGKNSIAYADSDKIIIFNIWSGDSYLKNKDIMPCFSDWTSALFYTAQEIPQMI